MLTSCCRTARSLLNIVLLKQYLGSEALVQIDPALRMNSVIRSNDNDATPIEKVELGQSTLLTAHELDAEPCSLASAICAILSVDDSERPVGFNPVIRF